MSKLHDLLYMSRDFYRVARGKDYFHQPQPLGRYFQDDRSYYNDFRGKADWDGARIEGIPALFLPALGRQITFPIMVLQYGLGSIDRHLETGKESYLRQVQAVTGWILENQGNGGSFENYFPSMDTSKPFYSGNSGMAQGETLSFLVRVLELELAGTVAHQALRDAMAAAFANMIQAMQDGGTSSTEDGLLRFHEVCGKDHQVILNGWIYATFGLIDYSRHTQSDGVSSAVQRTLTSLEADLPRYMLPDGWSIYDSLGRVASPFYHTLHIHLMDALFKLTGKEAFGKAYGTFRRAATPWKKGVYTARKVVDKIRDKKAYSTQK